MKWLVILVLVGWTLGGDREVLEALYNAAGGPTWINNTDWMSPAPTCAWYGISCTGRDVTAVTLVNNHLTGTLPDDLGSFVAVTTLYFGTNPSLGGTLPSQLANLASLENLLLSFTQITGTIPTEFAVLKSTIVHLDLPYTEVFGPFPDWVCSDFSGMASFENTDLWCGAYGTCCDHMNIECPSVCVSPAPFPSPSPSPVPPFPSPFPSPSPSSLPSPSPSPSSSPSPAPVSSPSPFPTPFPIPSPLPTPSPFPTPFPSPSPFPSPLPSSLPSPSPFPSSSPSPSPVSPPSPFPIPSPYPTPSSFPPPFPVPTPAPFPSPSPPPFPTPTPFPIPSPFPAPSPPFPSPSPFPIPSPTPSPSQPSPLVYSPKLCSSIRSNQDFGTIDGSLYLCLPDNSVPPSQPLSSPCSLFFSHPHSGPLCRISYLFGPSLLQISYSLLLPGDILDLSSVISSPSYGTHSPLYCVPLVPVSLNPFIISLSGPSHITLPAAKVCWEVKSLGGGGRGMLYEVIQGDSVLVGLLEWEEQGEGKWEGEGRGKLCLEKEGWGELSPGEYIFGVQGTSALFGSSVTAFYSFTLSSSLPSSSHFSRFSRFSSHSSSFSSNCNPTLWENSPSSLYGIQTFPSGQTLLPSSLRSLPLTITTKALSPCPQVGMSKNILAPSTLKWSFISPTPSFFDDHNISDWAQGTKLIIPVQILENRDAFPMNVPVGIRVMADFGENQIYLAETYVHFLPSGVNVVTDPIDLSSIVDVGDQLVIDLRESSTLDGLQVGEGSWEWEWDWTCTIPEGVTISSSDRNCRYEGGQIIQMPGISDAIFESENDESLEGGVPLLFLVRARVREEGGGNVVAEGKWEKVFTPLMEQEGMEVDLVETSWMCQDSSVGYLVQFLLNEGEITSSELLSLWSENKKDFGELEILTISPGGRNQLTQIRCTCDRSCSEPIFVRAELEIANEEVVIYFIYQPSGVLAPVQGNCETFVETYGGGDDIYSGLTFVGVNCEDAVFLNGIAPHQIWFEVNNGGDGTISSPVSFPPPSENYYASLQLFLSCGQEVTIYSKPVGYRDNGPPAFAVAKSNDFTVNSWTNELENDFLEAQNIIDSSPEVSFNFDFVILQTLSLPCFPPETFSPLKPETIIEDILTTPVPTNPEDILVEASIIAITTTPPTTPSPTPTPTPTAEEQQQIIERLSDYLEIITISGPQNPEVVETLAVSITDTTSNIIAQNPPKEILDDVYEVVENLEVLLLCSKTCGEDPSVILGDNVQIGASLNSLEDLKEINLGQLSFSLPDNLDELQDILGGEGACVQVGYSLISTKVDKGVPTASLAFFTVNCQTGTWEEIPITLSDSFIITIPIDKSEQSTKSKDKVVCYSGQSLSSLIDPDGCEFISQIDTEVVCECTHLTAFSALFLPHGDSGGWEWGTIQTIAISLLGFCILVAIIAIILEHYLVYAPMMRTYHTALKNLEK